MPIVGGTLAFSRLYSIDTIVAGDFGGTHPNNTLTLSNLSQVNPSAVDPSTTINDADGNGILNGADVVTTTFPGDSTTTTLTRVNLFAQFGGIANSFGSGIEYAIFEDPSGQQYILFADSFDVSRISGGSLTLTEQGDATGNMANSEIICFTPGTGILTPWGERPVENLTIGDLVVTKDHGVQPIRWIGKKTVSGRGKHAPVSIKSKVFCNDREALVVSPQHRILFTGFQAELLFGQSEVLVPAKTLVDGKDVTFEAQETVTYIHIMFDQHEIIFANGVETESFFPGGESLTAIGEKSRDELFRIFPDLRTTDGGFFLTSRPCLKAYETSLLRQALRSAAFA